MSPRIRDDWRNECILVQKSSLAKEGGRLKFKLPEKFVDFYEIPNSEVDVSGLGDEILLTVGSTIIPVELPYDYEPETEHTERNNRLADAKATLLKKSETRSN